MLTSPPKLGVKGIVGLLGAGTAFLVLWSALRHVFSRTRAVPGPFLARFTNLWFLWRTNTKRLERDLLAIHRRHGKLGPSRIPPFGSGYCS